MEKIQLIRLTKSDIDSIPKYYDPYISLTRDMPVDELLEKERRLAASRDIKLMKALEDQVYQPGKWTIKDIIQHVIDSERILAYRALRFARKDQTLLPPFDGNLFTASANAASRTLESVLDEYTDVRRGTISLFRSFSNEMLLQEGICSGFLVSVLALGYIIAGHQLHHTKIIRERYLPLLSQSSRTE
jgi:hypothetical protein